MREGTAMSGRSRYLAIEGIERIEQFFARKRRLS